jgi:hypothetical protein
VALWQGGSWHGRLMAAWRRGGRGLPREKTILTPSKMPKRKQDTGLVLICKIIDEPRYQCCDIRVGNTSILAKTLTTPIVVKTLPSSLALIKLLLIQNQKAQNYNTTNIHIFFYYYTPSHNNLQEHYRDISINNTKRVSYQIKNNTKQQIQ